MRLSIEAAGRTEIVNGAPCRLWNGQTPAGARCLVFVWAVEMARADVERFGQEPGRLVIDSTPATGNLNGVDYRLWHGTSAGGLSCRVFVAHVAVADDQDAAEFDAELQERPAPAEWPPLPLPQIDPTHN
jgi:hypothetical protein